MQSDLIINKKIFVQAKQEPFEAHYSIHPKLIYNGSSSRIYKVKSKSEIHNVWRAAKTISKKSPKHISLAINQISILKSLDHPNVIKIFETYETEESICIVQDLCEGGQLLERLSSSDKLTEAVVKKIFRQCVETIYYCHYKKVCHRDIKPENILLTQTDRFEIKIANFGKAFTWQNDMKSQLKLNSNNNLVGTIYYIAPQIVNNPNEYDQKCDIWSLGVLLYVMLSSAFPFDGETQQQVLSKIAKYQYSIQIPSMKSISMHVKDLIKKILVPPAERISLQQILKHPWVTSQPNPIPIKINIKNLNKFSKFSKTKKITANFIASQIGAEDMQKLTRMFKQIDLNKDGEISFQELKQALEKQKVNSSEITKLMSSIDMDHNGVISYTEFIASASGQNLFDEKHIARTFSMLDKDGNGVVDRQELFQLLASEGVKDINGKSVDEIVKECDKDGNGVIDFKEFKDCVMKK